MPKPQQLYNDVLSKAKEIHTDAYPMSIGELMSLYRDKELDIHPEFAGELAPDFLMAAAQHVFVNSAHDRQPRAVAPAHLDHVHAVLRDGAARAKAVARQVLDRAKKASGLD